MKTGDHLGNRLCGISRCLANFSCQSCFSLRYVGSFVFWHPSFLYRASLKLAPSIRTEIQALWRERWLMFAPCRWRWTRGGSNCCPRRTSWARNLWREVIRPESQSYSAQHLMVSSVVHHCRGFLRNCAHCGAECPSDCRGSTCGCGRQHADDATSFFKRLLSLSAKGNPAECA